MNVSEYCVLINRTWTLKWDKYNVKNVALPDFLGEFFMAWILQLTMGKSRL